MGRIKGVGGHNRGGSQSRNEGSTRAERGNLRVNPHHRLDPDRIPQKGTEGKGGGGSSYSSEYPVVQGQKKNTGHNSQVREKGERSQKTKPNRNMRLDDSWKGENRKSRSSSHRNSAHLRKGKLKASLRTRSKSIVKRWVAGRPGVYPLADGECRRKGGSVEAIASRIKDQGKPEIGTEQRGVSFRKKHPHK